MTRHGRIVQSQNDRLKAQLARCRRPPRRDRRRRTRAKLKAANTQITSLQSTVTVVTLEKGALENRVKQLSAEVEQLRAANFEGRIRDLTEQRDELAKELANAGRKSSRKNTDAQLAALTNEMQTLRARLAVVEAKPVPYSAEELALFRESTPQPTEAKRSIHELPVGAAELVLRATAFCQP